MHLIARLSVLALAGLCLAAPVYAQETAASLPPAGTALVFVNTQAILPVAPGADSAQARFQVVLQGYQQELEQLSTQIDSMVAAYRQQEAMMTQEGRDQKQQEIVDLQRAAQNRQTELEQLSDRQRNELLTPILQNVTDIIEAIRDEQQYAIVFDIAESGVIAADKSLDITAAVLERLGVDPGVLAANPVP